MDQLPSFFLEFLKIRSCFCVVRKFFTVFVEPISFDTLLPYKQQQEQQQEQRPVSYTHLTLPTIYSV